MGQLAQKSSFEELTPKQQRIVDVAVQNPDATQQTIADEADVRRTYVSRVINQYPEIVEARRAEKASDADPIEEFEEEADEPGAEADANGSEETVVAEKGNGSYEGPAEGIDAAFQHISERPYVKEGESDVPTVPVEIELTRSDVLQMITTGSVPDHVVQMVLESVVDDAFRQ